MTLRSVILLLVALGLAFVAAVVAKRWLEAQTRSTQIDRATDTTPIVVAAVDIPYGSMIEAEQLKVVAWPTQNLPANIFHDSKEVIGKITAINFARGDLIVSHRVNVHLGGSALSSLIKQGMRAISVRVNDVVGVAGFILPGNNVDVLSSRNLAPNEFETKTVLENLRVLAIDQEASTDQSKPAIVRAVTLELDPEQARKLVDAMNEGELQLALRNPLDSQIRGPEEEGKVPAPVIKPIRVSKRNPRPRLLATIIKGTAVNQIPIH